MISIIIYYDIYYNTLSNKKKVRIKTKKNLT